MRKSNLLGGALLFAALFVNTSCKEIFGNMDLSGDTTVSSYVAINTATKTAAPAEEFTLSITKIGDGTVTWSSSDPAIAEVQGAGLSAKVIAKKSGNATITANVAAAGNYQAGSAKCAVAVRIQNFEQLKAELGDETTEVKAYLAENANIVFDANQNVVGKKVFIIGDEQKPATFVVTKQFTFDNDFEISNVTLDFTNQSNDFLKFMGEATELTKFEGVKFENVKAIGMKKCLFNMNSKQTYLMNNFSIINSVIEMTADQPIINFKSSGCAYNINIDKSTMYCSSTDDAIAKKALPYTSQSGKGITQLDENGKQTFNITNSTFYNLSKSANFFTLAKNSQKWLVYNVNNNIFVDCGKDKQTIIGINQGQQSDNPTWTVSGNVINYGGNDRCADEKNPYSTKATPIVNSIAKVVSFKDAAKGDFTQSDADAGDPRWKKL